jgi:hypothetical protein
MVVLANVRFAPKADIPSKSLFDPMATPPAWHPIMGSKAHDEQPRRELHLVAADQPLPNLDGSS